MFQYSVGGADAHARRNYLWSGLYVFLSLTDRNNQIFQRDKTEGSYVVPLPGAYSLGAQQRVEKKIDLYEIYS